MRSPERTLYVHRPLLNAGAVIEWAKKSGFKSTLEPKDMHVTLLYSKGKLRWPEPVRYPHTSIQPDGIAREVKPLGDKGAVVLGFDDPNLWFRWRDLINAGATHDYSAYQPHVTITYDGKDVDCSKLEPFSGELQFGPEAFAELDEDWDSKISEKKTA